PDGARVVPPVAYGEADVEWNVPMTRPHRPMVSARGSPPRPLTWIEGRRFRFNNIVLTFHRSGHTGPATELGFNLAKGMYSIFKRQ
ncbi:MAG: hypothetical protein AB1762_21200, partial [Gemmatimonadota bacterium]